MNPANYQYPFFQLYLASYIGGEPAITGMNVARLQRTSKSAHHSTSGRGNGVIQRGRVGFRNQRWINLVVLGDGAVDAECHWL
ncbi:MAG TPA: hypothetical protein VG168_14260 [Bryobacteraceae bacterium]|nr:hypothetical protein [Bryobacteraceae bacterium]